MLILLRIRYSPEVTAPGSHSQSWCSRQTVCFHASRWKTFSQTGWWWSCFHRSPICKYHSLLRFSVKESASCSTRESGGGCSATRCYCICPSLLLTSKRGMPAVLKNIQQYLNLPLLGSCTIHRLHNFWMNHCVLNTLPGSNSVYVCPATIVCMRALRHLSPIHAALYQHAKRAALQAGHCGVILWWPHLNYQTLNTGGGSIPPMDGNCSSAPWQTWQSRTENLCVVVVRRAAE